MNNGFDERQLWLRGQVFKHSLLFMGALLLLDILLGQFGLSLASDRGWGHVLVIALTTAFCWDDLILREAVNFDDKSTRSCCMILGAVGLFLLVWGCVHVLLGAAVLDGHALSEEGVRMVMALGWLSVGVCYPLKVRQMRAMEEA